jgi:hypothetical protein
MGIIPFQIIESDIIEIRAIVVTIINFSKIEPGII